VSGRNPRLGQLLGGKPRMLVLNKIDLADEKCTKVSEVLVEILQLLVIKLNMRYLGHTKLIASFSSHNRAYSRNVTNAVFI